MIGISLLVTSEFISSTSNMKFYSSNFILEFTQYHLSYSFLCTWLQSLAIKDEKLLSLLHISM